MATLISANVSDVKVDGESVPGLKYIDYRIVRNSTRTFSIGGEEMPAVIYGQMHVAGTLRVESTYPLFDTMLITGVADIKPFQLVVKCKHGDTEKTLSFDECYLESKTFSMTATGIGISEYTFTGVRLREQ